VQKRTAHVEKLGNERDTGGEGKTDEEARIIRALGVRRRDTFVNDGELRQDDILIVLRLLGCQTKKASSMSMMYKTRQMEDIQRLLQWSVTETIRVVIMSHPEQPEFLLTSSMAPSPSESPSSSSPSKLT
jgi:hypothetical protein